MAMTLEEIEAAALELSSGEQARLLASLGASLHDIDPETKKAWIEEAKRRWADVRSGKTETVPGEAVLRDARARLNVGL